MSTMLDQLFYKFISLMEVKFVLALLVLAATMDIMKRFISARQKRNTNLVEIDSVLDLYQENSQSGRHTNGVRHFRTNSHNLHEGFKEV